ncbi:hypothetical protein [Streptomyces cyaneofuscatus]|uniref:hypothetical protein n=1 Tax=Streptomyces cyaneofuscatus TaxID=66883 RepID=UPI00362B4097
MWDEDCERVGSRAEDSPGLDIPGRADSLEQPGGAGELWCHVEELKITVASMRGEIDSLRRENAQLESRLDAVIASWTEYRTDIDTEESEAHRVLGERYANFVEQSLYGLARKAVASKLEGAQPVAVADLMRKLCGEIFGRAEVVEPRIRRALGVKAGDDLAKAVHKVVVQGSGIVAESNRMQNRGFWEFDHIPGSPVDSNRQRAWQRCDASALVQFVVAPAYTANRITYCRQWVYTESR